MHLSRSAPCLVLALALLGGAAGAHSATPAPPGARFAIAFIGDVPYAPQEEQAFVTMMGKIDKADVAFVVHVGDIKSGSSPCTDEGFAKIHGLFQRSLHPFVYIPGDNEWTDCHRKGGDPVERLQKLRQMFWQDDGSLGQAKLKLERQPKYPENVIWTYGDVLFVGLNIPGSNNNLGRTPAMDAEYQERNTANLAWLKEAFRRARVAKLKGVVPFIQANPGFELEPKDRTGYNDFLAALTAETVAFPGVVMLVHGDTHFFRIDKPMRVADGQEMVANFTRLETFGSPFTYWVRVTVDPARPELFEIHPQTEWNGPGPAPKKIQ